SLSEGGVNNFEFIYENQEEVFRTINAFCHYHLTRDNMVLGHEVVLAEQDENLHWKITLDNGAFIKSRFVVFATGQLSTPNFPDIQWGSKQCSVHTGEWKKSDAPLDRVRSACVVGGAASAIQLAIELAEKVETLTIISPHYNWFYNVPHYRNRTDVGLRNLLCNVNFFQSIFRVTAFMDQDTGNLPNVSFGQEGTPDNVQMFKDQCTSVLKGWGIEEFTPDYMPGEKRILVDDGSWARTIRRDNVTYIKDRVCAVDGGMVKTQGGISSQFDKVFFATGFTTDSFTGGVKVKNFQQKQLNEYWGNRPRALVGIVVPEFDNLFIMYGPNTNGVVNGHALWFLELQAEVIAKYISKTGPNFGWWENDMAERLQKFIELVDYGNSRRTWGQGTVDSWYRYKNNTSVQNWPFSLSSYYQSIYYFEQFRETTLK
ncbi:NAD(P)-binding domain-containing protein, partial [Rhodospirillaceae bacterium]|nr:NAD(P)-binding domain-containing protein [Rhodospirillaceae bacterium]